MAVSIIVAVPVPVSVPVPVDVAVAAFSGWDFVELGTQTSQNSKPLQVPDSGELLEMPMGGSAAAVLCWRRGWAVLPEAWQ